MSINGQKRLALYVPESKRESDAILAAYYYKEGKLSFDQAYIISGVNSEKDFKEILKGNKKNKKTPWAESAKYFLDMKNKAPWRLKEGYRFFNFSKWVTENYGSRIYIRHLLRAYEVFGGSRIEELTQAKAYLLTMLESRHREQLKRDEKIEVNGKQYGVDDFKEMSPSQLRVFILKTRAADKHNNGLVVEASKCE